MSSLLRVGLAGAGAFATYHANKISAHERASFVGLHDRDAAKAQTLASAHAVPVFDSLDALFEASDAVIVALPATVHFDAALKALEADCHLLVEKPLATRLEDAERLVAEASGRVLQVGHQERVVLRAIGLDRIEARPHEIAVIRHTGPATRNLDASVIYDLMIHDLDLLLMLYGQPDWTNLEAAKAIQSDHYDHVSAELGFGPMTARVSAARYSEPERRWTLRYEDGTVEIDFGRKTLRHDTLFQLNEAFGERPEVADSLGEAFDRFVRACLDGDPPLATGQDGMAAVRVASQIEGTP
jgi:predicted dehydrogenase